MSSSPEPERLRRIRASALWAAYGDALGFITELADSAGVARRGGRMPLATTQPWRRRIGGRFGTVVELPAGCLSDDTQLRLATCRAIRGDGVFDVELFAKVELPVWLAYALGAGRGSQEAAANLRRRDVTWATNFYEAERSVYINGGGNGAAMRIQPHVWAAGDTSAERWQTDVIVNAVCTHGHMRGVVGALFHAACLHDALRTGTIPGPERWVELVSELERCGALIRRHPQLEHLWLGLWEARSPLPLDDAVQEVLAELHGDVATLRAQPGSAPEAAYGNGVEALGAYRADQRGSATKTALLGVLAAWLFADQPEHGLATCANRLGTDTDSIATMAGALLGATLDDDPDARIADRAYIEREAQRLWAIAERRQAPTFPYPRLVKWTSPRTALDCLGEQNGDLALAGLGPALGGDEVFAGSGKNAGAWSWVDLWFGQRVLVKRRRPRPKSLPSSQLVNPAEEYLTSSLLDAPPRPDRGERRLHGKDHNGPPHRRSDTNVASRRTLHVITDEVIGSGFAPEIVGKALLELADRDDGVEAATQYAAILAKARLSRRDRERRQNGEGDAAPAR